MGWLFSENFCPLGFLATGCTCGLHVQVGRLIDICRRTYSVRCFETLKFSQFLKDTSAGGTMLQTQYGTIASSVLPGLWASIAWCEAHSLTLVWSRRRVEKQAGSVSLFESFLDSRPLKGGAEKMTSHPDGQHSNTRTCRMAWIQHLVAVCTSGAWQAKGRRRSLCLPPKCCWNHGHVQADIRLPRRVRRPANHLGTRSCSLSFASSWPFLEMCSRLRLHRTIRSQSALWCFKASHIGCEINLKDLIDFIEA